MNDVDLASLVKTMSEAKLTPANLIIANTGVADDIAEPQIPTGTQCFAWLFKPQDRFDPLVIYTETIVFAGTREQIRQQSAHYALGRIEHWLRLAKQERQGMNPGV